MKSKESQANEEAGPTLAGAGLFETTQLSYHRLGFLVR
jgi:hypothetical protein